MKRQEDRNFHASVWALETVDSCASWANPASRNEYPRTARRIQPFAVQRWERLTFGFLTRAGCLLLILVGCSADVSTEKDSAKESASDVARSQVERGPVRVTVEVQPKQARLSDEPELTLTIEYDHGVNVEKPPFGEAMGDFIIRDFREPVPESRADRTTIRQIYTLEPTRTGKIAIDPIRVPFTDNREQGDGKSHTINTEALTIDVASVLGTEAPSLENLQPSAGPVPLPATRGPILWWAAGCLLVLILAAAVWKLRRRPAPTIENILSPRELAYLELQRLIQERLAETDVKTFYVELTGIVRRYIERTTGVRAPEQTTEEFLVEISRGETFAKAEGERLQEFLEAADLVKFAAQQPQSEDIENSFQRAKRFLGLQQDDLAA